MFLRMRKYFPLPSFYIKPKKETISSWTYFFNEQKNNLFTNALLKKFKHIYNELHCLSTWKKITRGFLGIAQSLESGKEFSHVQIVLGATAIYHVVSDSTDLFVVLNTFLEIRSPVSFQIGKILLLAIETGFHFPPKPHVILFPQTKEIKFLAIR